MATISMVSTTTNNQVIRVDESRTLRMLISVLLKVGTILKLRDDPASTEADAEAAMQEYREACAEQPLMNRVMEQDQLESRFRRALEHNTTYYCLDGNPNENSATWLAITPFDIYTTPWTLADLVPRPPAP